MADHPLVMLPTFCPWHIEACAVEDRRRGGGVAVYVLMQIAVLQRAAAHDDVARECGWDPANAKLADAALLLPALQKRAPLCCWISDDAFGAALLEVLSDRRLERARE